MRKTLLLAAALGLLTGTWSVARADEKKGGKTPAELEKEKALRDPYPNDAGPDKLDEAYVKSLSADQQEGYKLLQAKCSKCHSPARPLNSQFVEAPGKTDEEREAALKTWKTGHPELFKDKTIYQPEASIWSRYVKRMMAKPGCDIAKPEGKKIWEFLSADSVKRKTGEKAEAWQKHRGELMEKFKKDHADRYKELFGAETKAEKKG